MIRREFTLFLFVGALTVLTDFLTYRCLLWTELLGVNSAKSAGFIAGMLFAYFANRLWTFGHKKHDTGSPLRFTVLYTTTLVVNVCVNAFMLKLLVCSSVSAIKWSFLIATGVSASLNFMGLKFFVFKSRLS